MSHLKLIEVRRLIRQKLAEGMEDDALLVEAPGGMYHPPGHLVGMRVTKGGSMCGNCKWVKEAQYCSNKYFQKWNAEANGAKSPARLPAPADEYCCDNWQG